MAYKLLLSSNLAGLHLESLSLPVELDTAEGGIIRIVETPGVFWWKSNVPYVISQESKSIIEAAFNALSGKVKKDYQIFVTELSESVSNLYSSLEVSDDKVLKAVVVDIQKGALKSGSTTVTTAGSAVRLTSTSIPVKSPVTLIWHPDNAGRIYPGPENVGNGLTGAYLDSDIRTLILDVSDLNEIYLNADNNGDSVLYIAS